MSTVGPCVANQRSRDLSALKVQQASVCRIVKLTEPKLSGSYAGGRNLKN